jgi:hypothetical protein
VTTAGPLCDVTPSGTSLSQGTPRSTVVSDGRKSRVVVSEPASGFSKFGWRASDPETPPAITEVNGAIEDSAVRK